MHTIIPTIKELGVAPPAGDVSFVGTGTTDEFFGGGSTTHSYSHNRTAATQGALIVAVMSDVLTNGVTYNAVSLTLVREEGFGSAGTSYWIGPNTLATGSNTVVITHASSTSASIGRADNLENVNQSTMTGNTNGANGTLGSSSLAVTIAAGAMAIDTVAKPAFDPNANGDGNQVILHDNSNSNSIKGAGSFNSSQTAGSKTLAWTWSSTANTGHVIMEVNNG